MWPALRLTENPDMAKLECSDAVRLPRTGPSDFSNDDASPEGIFGVHSHVFLGGRMKEPFKSFGLRQERGDLANYLRGL